MIYATIVLMSDLTTVHHHRYHPQCLPGWSVVVALSLSVLEKVDVTLSTTSLDVVDSVCPSLKSVLELCKNS